MLHRAAFPALFVLCSLTAQPAGAQPLSQAEAQRVEAVLADVGAADEPGVAVGIVRGGDVVLERYFGLADMSHSIALGPDSRTNIASNAKQYVALMVLDLAERGQIDLDADFRTYLSDVMPAVGETITVTNLLTHTSGVRDVYDLWALTGITYIPPRFLFRNS